MVALTSRLAERAKGRRASPIRELMPYLSLPGMISLGGGYPNPETFAFSKVGLTFKSGREAEITGGEAVAASQYGPTPSHKELGSTLLEWHHYKDNVTLDPNQMVVLNGSQEGLFIAAYLFLEQSDSIVVAEPVYPGTISAASGFCRNFKTVPLDGDGMVTELLEQLLSGLVSTGDKMPKFVYTVPSGHNPGGVTLSMERRRHLLEIARRFDILVLEDDPYQLVRLEKGANLPTIQEMEGNPERVIRLDSFSKIFAPGLRIGYVSGPEEIIREFVLFKQSANLHTSMLVQALLETYLQTHGFEEFSKEIETNCQLYRRNRDAMLDAAEEFLPDDVHYNSPEHGMFIWFSLPAGFDAERMVAIDCEDLKVLLVPGSAFSVSGGLKNCMRASFSLVSPKDIREGIRRFSEMISRERLRCLENGS